MYRQSAQGTHAKEGCHLGHFRGEHAHTVIGTEESLNDSQTVKDIKVAIAQNLEQRFAKKK